MNPNTPTEEEKEIQKKISEFQGKLDMLRSAMKISEEQYKQIQDQITQETSQNRKISQIQAKLESLDVILENTSSSLKEITKKEWQEISNYNNPPERVKICLEGVFLLLKGKVLTWKEIQTEMNSPSFIPNILKFNYNNVKKQHMEQLRKDYIETSKWDLKKFQTASKAIGPLATWLYGVKEYYQEHQKALPYKKQMEEIKFVQKQLKAQEQEILGDVQEQKRQQQELENELAEMQEALKDIQNAVVVEENIVKKRFSSTVTILKKQQIKINQIDLDEGDSMEENSQEEENDEDENDEEQKPPLKDFEAEIYQANEILLRDQSQEVMVNVAVENPVNQFEQNRMRVKSQYQGTMTFNKQEETDLLNTDLEALIRDRDFLRQELSEAQMKLKQQEEKFLLLVDEKANNQNTLQIPIEKQINRKQTQILRDKGSENESLKMRILTMQESMAELEQSKENEISSLKAQLVAQERKFEEQLNQNRLDIHQMEEDFQNQINELRSTFDQSEVNLKYIKLQQEIQKKSDILEGLQRNLQMNLDKVEKMLEEKNYEALQNLFHELRENSRKKSSVFDLSIIEKEGLFLDDHENDHAELRNLQNELEDSGKQAMESLETTVIKKKVELCTSQIENLKAVIKNLEEKLANMQKEKMNSRNQMFELKKILETKESDILHLQQEIDFQIKKQDGLKNQELFFRNKSKEYEERHKKNANTMSTLYQQLDYLDEENDKKDVRISQMEAELASLKQLSEELKNLKELSDVKQKEDQQYIISLQGQVQELGEQLKNADLFMDQLEAESEDVTNLCANQKAQIEMQLFQEQRINQKIELQEKDLKQFKEKIDFLDNENKNLRSEVKNLDELIQTYKGSQGESVYDKNVDSIEIEALKLVQQQKDEKISQLENLIEELKSKQQMASEQVSTLKEENAAKKQQIEDLLEIQNSFQQSRKQSLRNRGLSSLDPSQLQAIEILQKKNQELSQEVFSLQERFMQVNDFKETQLTEDLRQQLQKKEEKIEEMQRDQIQMLEQLKNAEKEHQEEFQLQKEEIENKAQEQIQELERQLKFNEEKNKKEISDQAQSLNYQISMQKNELLKDSALQKEDIIFKYEKEITQMKGSYGMEIQELHQKIYLLEQEMEAFEQIKNDLMNQSIENFNESVLKLNNVQVVADQNTSPAEEIQVLRENLNESELMIAHKKVLANQGVPDTLRSEVKQENLFESGLRRGNQSIIVNQGNQSFIGNFIEQSNLIDPQNKLRSQSVFVSQGTPSIRKEQLRNSLIWSKDEYMKKIQALELEIASLKEQIKNEKLGHEMQRKMTNERLSKILQNPGNESQNLQWVAMIKEKEIITREKETLVQKYEQLVLRVNGLDKVLKIDNQTQTDVVQEINLKPVQEIKIYSQPQYFPQISHQGSYQPQPQVMLQSQSQYLPRYQPLVNAQSQPHFQPQHQAHPQFQAQPQYQPKSRRVLRANQLMQTDNQAQQGQQAQPTSEEIQRGKVYPQNIHVNYYYTLEEYNKSFDERSQISQNSQNSQIKSSQLEQNLNQLNPLMKSSNLVKSQSSTILNTWNNQPIQRIDQPQSNFQQNFQNQSVRVEQQRKPQIQKFQQIRGKTPGNEKTRYLNFIHQGEKKPGLN